MKTGYNTPMKLSCILILASLPLLVSCHRDTRPDWQKADAVAHLKIPDGVDTPGRSAEMVVPAATGETEAMVHNDTTPPTTVSLTSENDVDTAWQTVSNRLAKSGAGTVLSRDDQQHHLSLNIKGSALPQPDRGFFSNLFHSKPDPARKYFATVGVISQNGVTTVNIDGDGEAVLHLGTVLAGGSLRPVAQKGGSVSTAAPRKIEFEPSGAKDASGEPAG